jgi:hypothetical protein
MATVRAAAVAQHECVDDIRRRDERDRAQSRLSLSARRYNTMNGITASRCADAALSLSESPETDREQASGLTFRIVPGVPSPPERSEHVGGDEEIEPGLGPHDACDEHREDDRHFDPADFPEPAEGPIDGDGPGDRRHDHRQNDHPHERIVLHLHQRPERIPSQQEGRAQDHRDHQVVAEIRDVVPPPFELRAHVVLEEVPRSIRTAG